MCNSSVTDFNNVLSFDQGHWKIRPFHTDPRIAEVREHLTPGLTFPSGRTLQSEVQVLTRLLLSVWTCRYEAQDDAGGQDRRGLHQVFPPAGSQKQTGRDHQIIDGPAEQNVLLWDLRRARQLRDSAKTGEKDGDTLKLMNPNKKWYK